MTSDTATPQTSTDRIEKDVVLNASRSRVWRALTDVSQFNTWFGVALTSAFAPGAAVTGSMTNKKYEHITMTVWIDAMEPERFFSFRWHPYALDTSVDYSNEPTTLVSFTLQEVANGTRLSIVESGFDAIPAERRAQAFAMNSRGWAGQSENIRKFVEA